MSTDGADVHLKAIAPSGVVELARVQRGAKPVLNGGINETYHGDILVPSGLVKVAYIKDLNARELANELLVASLARMTGLATPVSYLAMAEAGVLPLTKAPAQKDGSKLVFASEDAQSPSLRYYYDTSNFVVLERLIERLAEWDHLWMLYGLDTWCANVDRNLGNVLVGANDVHLIDHGQCFTGPSWTEADLKSDAEYQNKIRSWLTPNVPLSQRSDVAKDAANLATTTSDALLSFLPVQSRAADFLSPTEAVAIIDFLKERRQHVLALATSALDMLVA